MEFTSFLFSILSFTWQLLRLILHMLQLIISFGQVRNHYFVILFRFFFLLVYSIVGIHLFIHVNLLILILFFFFGKVVWWNWIKNWNSSYAFSLLFDFILRKLSFFLIFFIIRYWFLFFEAINTFLVLEVANSSSFWFIHVLENHRINFSLNCINISIILDWWMSIRCKFYWSCHLLV